MVTPDDVAKVVLDRLAAVTSSSTICPGGHWFDRGPDDPAGYPYDVFRVEAGPARIVSEFYCFQSWTIRLAGYAPVGETGVTVANVEKLFLDALITDAANTALRAVSLRNTGEAVIHGLQSAAEGRYDPTLREGRDVFVAGLTAELLVMGLLSAT